LKKLIAITLLLVHLFNIGGQLALHQFLVYKSDKFFNEQIGKNYYNLNDLTEIRIPINIPKAVTWQSYVKVAGRVQFKNTAYNYVKIKITQSAIYLLCVPNYETTHLCNHNIIDASHIDDIPVPKKNHVPFGKLNIVAYSYQAIHYWFLSPTIEIGQIIPQRPSFIIKSTIEGPGQPPDPGTINS
jgi:hypothetical protein